MCNIVMTWALVVYTSLTPVPLSTLNTVFMHSSTLEDRSGTTKAFIYALVVMDFILLFLWQMVEKLSSLWLPSRV